MRLHRVAALATSLLLPLSLGACSTGMGGTGDASPIVIAADLELSGVDAPIGITYQRALELRIDEINAAGGVGGRQVQLMARDNRSDPAVSSANISTFVSDPTIAGIIVGACSACAAQIAKTVDDKRFPTITLAPALDVVKPASDRPYVFKIGPNADDSAAALVDELKNNNIHSVAVFTTNDMDGTDATAATAAQIPKANHAAVKSTQTFASTATDVTQQVQTALLTKPDGLVVSAFPSQAVMVAEAAHAAGFTGKVFFDSTAAGDLFVGGAGAAGVENTEMVAPQTLVIDDVIATTPANAARKQWFNDYTAKYGTYSGYASYAADAVTLLTNAIRTTGKVDHAAMRDILEESQIDGLSGPIRITPDNHSGLMPQALTTLIVRSGRWRLLG